MRILFLYTELADYTLACFRALKNVKETTEIAVIHYPVNPEAPFNFDFGKTGVFTNIKAFGIYAELKSYVDKFRPDKIVVSGWANNWYLRICVEYRNKAVCVLTMDNHWMGTLKQKVYLVLFRLTLIHVFKKIWVPGDPQAAYAKRLGFRKQNIISGFYSCDVSYYSTLGEQTMAVKEKNFPKRLLCVARYIPAKNYETLWKAFIQWKSVTNNDWELWCAGTGEDFDKRAHHPAIRHLGFIQKGAWNEIIMQTGIFILPSSFEPWAVAVHEFAAAGYPLILSSNVGAATAFLKNENGWTFDPKNSDELVRIFKTMESLSSESLLAMGAQSRKVAQSITPERWAEALLGV